VNRLTDYFHPRAVQLELPPAAAAADPETSKLADREISASGARQTRAHHAAQLVRLHPGLTCLELATVVHEDRHILQKGLSDAAAAKLVVPSHKSEKRTCSVSGKKAVVWRPLR